MEVWFLVLGFFIRVGEVFLQYEHGFAEAPWSLASRSVSSSTNQGIKKWELKIFLCFRYLLT